MLADEQSQYLTVCVAKVEYKDGSKGLITRWRLSAEERERIAEEADLYLSLITFGAPMQPVVLEVGLPEGMYAEDES